MTQVLSTGKWVRSEKGWVAGVCQGIGERMDINPSLLRLGWLFSILFFGVGLLFYFIMAICLPVEGKEDKAYEPKFLGVCARLADKFDMDVGLTRVLAVVIALGSFGTTFLAYIILHFLVPENSSGMKNLK